MNKEQKRGRRRNSGGRRRRSGRGPLPKSSRTMLVSGTLEHAHVAVLENGDLVEHYVASESKPSLVGNIYLGKVQNVLPGMEAAFVDIGQKRNGVLYVGEVTSDPDVEGDTNSGKRIEEMLRSGQSVLVQVTKDSMGTKGARLTTQVSLAGRYMVLVPNVPGFGISKKLPDSERNRLKDIAKKIQPSQHTVIIRTAAAGVSEEDLTRDLERTIKMWDEIEKRKGGSAPREIYLEPEMAMRVVRDLFGRDVEKMIVESRETHAKIKSYVAAVDPELAQRIELSEGHLFEDQGVTMQLRKALDRKVWLPSGGYLIIDRTEALTVIDVNSGRFTSGKNLEDTVVKVNMEAATEITRQLRLRDIGGIIIVDFIDMVESNNREQILRAFRDELHKDRTKTQVIGISPLGLVEMTRKNVAEGVVEALGSPCPTCAGRGVVFNGVDGSPEKADQAADG